MSVFYLTVSFSLFLNTPFPIRCWSYNACFQIASFRFLLFTEFRFIFMLDPVKVKAGLMPCVSNET